MIKIAISGKANSGKNTVASLLTENLNFDDICFAAFADPIKKAIMSLYPTAEPSCLWGSSSLRAKKIPGTNITYRQVLLNLGSKARSYDEYHWTKIMENRIRNNNSEVFIIGDLRFQNEFEMLKKYDFFTIRVRRKEQLNSNDISETDQDKIKDSDFNHIIDNNGTLEDLNNICYNLSCIVKNKGQ